VKWFLLPVLALLVVGSALLPRPVRSQDETMYFIEVVTSRDDVTVGDDYSHAIVVVADTAKRPKRIWVTTSLPNGVTLKSFSADRGSCENSSANIVFCTMDVWVDHSGTITITVHVEPFFCRKDFVTSFDAVDRVNNHFTRQSTVRGHADCTIFLPGVFR
jgi:hypothetical protein